MSSRILVPTLLVSLLAAPCFGAEANFYSLNEQWMKESKSSKSGKADAVEAGFSRAFENGYGAASGPPVPVTLRRTLREASSSPIELEWGQTLLLDETAGLVKFVAADEGIVTLESTDNQTLRLTGTGIGSTYVHVWNSQGRTTLPVKVVQPRISISHQAIREQQAIEKDRPLRFSYSNVRTASYDGDKFREMPRSNIDFSQTAGLAGDTPYGALSSHVQTQKSRGKMLLSDAQVVLKDGHVGPVERFNAYAGDSRVDPALMVLPGARIRGGVVEKWDEPKKLQWTGFYGREDPSLFGTITPQLLSKRTLNSYLSGNVLDYKPSEDAKFKAGYFTGSGRSRPDELNRLGFDGKSEVNLGKHIVLQNETGFDNEKFANRHAFTTRFEKLVVKNEFRDISKKFNTLVGPPSQQGEEGYLLDVSANPSDQWAFQGSYDLFRDRLVANPEDPLRPNMHTNLHLDYMPCGDVNYGATYQDLDDTGRIGPSRLRNMGVQYNERFDMWGKNATLFGRYNHRISHQLTNSLSDFRQDQVTLGLYTTLFWGINFSVQKEWNVLEDVELGQTTYPAALTYTFDTNRQIGNSPFFAEARVRLRDEEETESNNSFMAGEDSAEFSGSLFYREYEDLEIFLTGSLTQYVPESLNVLSPRVEAQFYTGMRCNFDTPLKWTVSGDFEGAVFKDTNGDGVRQEGEPGIPGMAVVASDGKEAVTDAEGHYALKGVQGKKASLSLDSSRIPYGFVPTSDVQKMDITPKKTQTVDFGLTPRSDVTGIIFDDLNGNGKFDAGEPPVPNVQVLLDDGRSARSNISGVYTFSNALIGERTVTLAVSRLPEGYVPLTAPKRQFTLSEGVRYELHFPLRAQRAVTGRVYWDKNQNGALDDEDMPLEGTLVKLGTLSVKTDKDGWYLFDGLAPGRYALTCGAFSQDLEMPAEPKTYSGIDIALKKAAS